MDAFSLSTMMDAFSLSMEKSKTKGPLWYQRAVGFGDDNTDDNPISLPMDVDMANKCASWFFTDKFLNRLYTLLSKQFSSRSPLEVHESMMINQCSNLKLWELAANKPEGNRWLTDCKHILVRHFAGCFKLLTPDNQAQARREVICSIRIGGWYSNLPAEIMAIIGITPA